MKSILRDERGMALAIAIFALVVVGAMVAGAFFAGTQEQRVGENQRRVMTSFGIADAGAQERMLVWDPLTQNRIKQYPESSVAIPPTAALGGTGTYSGTWYRMGPNIFLLDITGQDTRSSGGLAAGGGARQRVGMIARIAPIEFGIKASLTTQGGVSVGGNAEIDGNDQIPTGWTSCDPPGPAQAGVRDNGGTVGTSGSGEVNGSPPVVNDPSINSGTFTTFGGSTYAQLAARATITIGGGNINTDPSFIGGVCNRADPYNWGDPHNPASACGNYFPIIHVTGNLTINNTQGQGILLVDGDLTVNGSWDFYGITIIQGDLKTAGGGSADAHFWGGVMAKNADLSTQNLNGHATLNFSSCSILAALQAASPISPMRQRGWVALF